MMSRAACGYELSATVPRPESEGDEYYDRMEARIAELRSGESAAALLAALDGAEEEVRVYRESGGAYGYVFYVMRVAELPGAR